jgi:hypothetical protein
VPGIGSSARRPLRLPRPAFQKALRRFSGSTNCLKQFPMHARFVLFVSFCKPAFIFISVFLQKKTKTTKLRVGSRQHQSVQAINQRQLIKIHQQPNRNIQQLHI